MSYSPNFVGNTAKGAATSARKVARNYSNGSGSTLPLGAPLSVMTNGLVTTVDVSDQASVDAFVGIYNQSTPNTASGLVIDSGVLENLTGYSFSVGDPIYINTSGVLSNVVPSIGVGGFMAGYYVIFVGVVTQNEFNPSQQDLKILIQKAGIL